MIEMQGLFIDGRRPRTKKEVKEVAAADPSRIEVEATSVFGDDWAGRLSDEAARNRRIHFCGPDPYNKRVFYGTITVRVDGQIRVQ